MQKIEERVKGYFGIHQWLVREYGNATKCQNEECDGTSHRYEWANLTGEYARDRKAFIMLCRKCHYRMDTIRARGNLCLNRLHEMTPENIVFSHTKKYGVINLCRACRNKRSRERAKRIRQARLLTINCQVCRVLFRQNVPYQKYCSEKCRYRNRYIIRSLVKKEKDTLPPVAPEGTNPKE